MTYKHLTTSELTLIADFWHQGTKAYRVAKLLQRSQETIYRLYRFLNDGKTIAQYLQTYQRHKRRCGRKQTQLSRLIISMRESKLVGRRILSLVEVNARLTVVCAPFIACLLATSMFFPLSSYR